MVQEPDERFAVLTAVSRVWAVAAIHGEAERLVRLHATLDERFALGDRLVYLGNYLGFGAGIPATLDELLRFRRRHLVPGMEATDIVYLRGAQEEMWHKLLQVQFAVAPGDVLDWMINQGVDATVRAYGSDAHSAKMRFKEGAVATSRWTTELRNAVQAHPGHNELLGQLKRAAYTAGGELLFVHAGLDPARPLDQQGDTFWWGSGYFTEMSEPYGGFVRVARGFDRRRQGPQRGPHAVTLDGGCGFGGPLIAACFTLDGEIADWIEA